jgi:hypothetical protein
VQQRKFSIIKQTASPDPRIDLGNSFLADVGTYLSDSEYHSYKMDHQFYEKNYKDLLEQNNITLNYDPDFVLIELPALIYNNYPADLMDSSHFLVPF